jgi:hypothetical protein
VAVVAAAAAPLAVLLSRLCLQCVAHLCALAWPAVGTIALINATVACVLILLTNCSRHMGAAPVVTAHVVREVALLVCVLAGQPLGLEALLGPDTGPQLVAGLARVAEQVRTAARSEHHEHALYQLATALAILCRQPRSRLLLRAGGHLSTIVRLAEGGSPSSSDRVRAQAASCLAALAANTMNRAVLVAEGAFMPLLDMMTTISSDGGSGGGNAAVASTVAGGEMATSASIRGGAGSMNTATVGVDRPQSTIVHNPARRASLRVSHIIHTTGAEDDAHAGSHDDDAAAAAAAAAVTVAGGAGVSPQRPKPRVRFEGASPDAGLDGGLDTLDDEWTAAGSTDAAVEKAATAALALLAGEPVESAHAVKVLCLLGGLEACTAALNSCTEPRTLAALTTLALHVVASPPVPERLPLALKSGAVSALTRAVSVAVDGVVAAAVDRFAGVGLQGGLTRATAAQPRRAVAESTAHAAALIAALEALVVMTGEADADTRAVSQAMQAAGGVTACCRIMHAAAAASAHKPAVAPVAGAGGGAPSLLSPTGRSRSRRRGSVTSTTSGGAVPGEKPREWLSKALTLASALLHNLLVDVPAAATLVVVAAGGEPGLLRLADSAAGTRNKAFAQLVETLCSRLGEERKP